VPGVRAAPAQAQSLTPLSRSRVSGLLLHPTSLPGRSGIGCLGQEAHRFAAWLAEAGQRVWQVLPLGPTGYGDSPYQCFSAFGGNPLLIDLEELVREGLLEDADLADAPVSDAGRVDYGAVIAYKRPLLQRAAERFASAAAPSERTAFAAFCQAHSGWLDDLAHFLALKAANDGRAWNTWERALAAREPIALARSRRELARDIGAGKVSQFLVFRQWQALRERCRALGIALMGDVPIFVAHDSADVWAHPELFDLDPDGAPRVQAGVPPDYFSETGQLWGNPLYRWDVMARQGFAWWIARLRSALSLFDRVRLDHFRGFEACWEVPGRDTTAEYGRWVKGPGAALFDTLARALGTLPIVAENLGVITPEVEALRERYSLPGMAVLQFAFGSDPQGNTFVPHNLTRDTVVYTGTHDNDTTVGWWTAGVGDTTRSEDDARRERDLARAYLRSDGSEIHWDFIRAALGSVADTAIVPVQDVLGLGSEARMNVPAREQGNWAWRLHPDQLTDVHRDRLRALAELFGRVAPRGSERAGETAPPAPGTSPPTD
jgi:4-alpha-glucanotransferase